MKKGKSFKVGDKDRNCVTIILSLEIKEII